MSERTGIGATVDRHGLLIYTAIAYLITWSLLIGAYLGIESGSIDADGAFVGIASNLAPAGPLIAALIVLAISRGRAGLAQLGRSMVRWRVHPAWYAFVFLVVPLLLTAGVMAVNGGSAIAAFGENFGTVMAQVPLGILSIAVFTGISEEPGWRGYAQPWSNRRYGPIVAALIVSVIWALWHLPNGLFDGSVPESSSHVLTTVAYGIVLAWVYNATGGSVLIVMLAHGANNAMAGLFTSVLGDTAAGMSIVAYSLLSAGIWGAVAILIAVVTRGRLGLAEPGGRARDDAAAVPRAAQLTPTD